MTTDKKIKLMIAAAVLTLCAAPFLLSQEKEKGLFEIVPDKPSLSNSLRDAGAAIDDRIENSEVMLEFLSKSVALTLQKQVDNLEEQKALNVRLEERIAELEAAAAKPPQPGKAPKQWVNMGTRPPDWALPHLERVSEYRINIKDGKAIKDAQVKLSALLDAAQAWYRPWPSEESPLYCTGALWLSPGPYWLDRPWVARGRLQIHGTPHHDGGSRIIWEGEQTDEPMIKVQGAHGRWAGSNFQQTVSGFQLDCQGEASGILWGCANWGHLSNVFVRDPSKIGIEVLHDTNGARISGCHVFGRGKKLPPREGTIGLAVNARTVLLLDGNKFEQVNRGCEFRNNSTVTMSGVHFEACNYDVISQNWGDRGATWGTFTSFANHTGQLALFHKDHRASHLRGAVARTKSAFYLHGGQRRPLAEYGVGYVPFVINTAEGDLPPGVTPIP